MILRQIDIERFGVWRGWSSGELAPGVTVLFGPNETGKSTLLEFLRGMFFGFGPRESFAYGEGGLTGQIVCEHRQTVYRIRRSWTPEGGEEVEILDGAGGHLGAPTLAKICPIDERTFNSIFALNLEDLAYLRTLDAGATGELLYELSLGVERSRLSRAFSQLRAASAELSDEQTLRSWQTERERLLDEIREFPTAARRYAELVKTHRRTRAALEAARRELEEWEDRRRRWDSLRSYLPVWNELLAVGRELERLGALQDIPAAAFERAFRIERALAAALKVRKALLERRAELRDQLAGLPVNRAILAYAGELEAFRAARGEVAAVETAIREIEGRIKRVTGEFADLHRRLGRELPGEPSSAVEATGLAELLPRVLPLVKIRPRDWSEARRALAAWKRYEGEARAVDRELESLRAQRDQLHAEISEQLQSLGASCVETALEERSRHATLLRKAAQVAEQLASLEARERQLRGERLSAIKGTSLPAKTWLFIGVPFVTGVTLLTLFLFSLLLVPNIGIGWPTGLTGAILVAAGVAVKLQAERSQQLKVQALRQEWEALGNEKQRLQEQRAAVQAELATAGPRLPAEIPRLEAEIRELESLGLKQTQLDQLLDRLRETEGRATQAREFCERAVKRITRFCRANALPIPETPEKAVEIFELFRRLAKICRQMRGLEARRRRLAEQREAWQSRLKDLVQAAGLTVSGDSPGEILEELLATYEQATEHRRRRQELFRALAATQRKLQKCRLRVARLRARLRTVFRSLASECDGPAGLSELHGRWQQAQALRQKSRELERTLWQAVQTAGLEIQDEHSLSAVFDNLNTHCEETLHHIQELQDRVAALENALTHLTDQLQALAGDRSMGEKRLALSAIETRIATYLRRRRVFELALTLFERVRRRYETDRQPRILQRASHFLAALTEGRYRRVWTPVDERVLLAEDETGIHRRSEELSRGTREQLFLALRLALVTDWGERGIRLPLILDDVLVNFDQGRVRAACRTLAEFASPQQQVLLLTCHEHIVRSCAELGLPVCVLTPQEARSHTAGRISRSLPSPSPQKELDSAGGDSIASVAREHQPDPSEAPSGNEGLPTDGASAQQLSAHGGRRRGRRSTRQPQAVSEPAVSQDRTATQPATAEPPRIQTAAGTEWILVPDPYPEGVAESSKSAGPSPASGETALAPPSAARIPHARAA